VRTVAVIGRKGGSGKTTIASHLAIGLYLRGRRTLLADCDPQGSAIEVLTARQGLGPDATASSAEQIAGLKAAAVEAGYDALVIDTPAVLQQETEQAVLCADLAILVVRPTFLDLSAAVHTTSIIRQLRRPGLVVMNQAPVTRENIEPPVVKRAVEALTLLRMPIAPVVVRSRAAYQSVLESGRSVEELKAEMAATLEMKELCAYIDRFVFGGGRASAPAPRMQPAAPARMLFAELEESAV
jgi:chromosome partitioning protein